MMPMRDIVICPEQIATASHLDDRILQIHIFLDCTYNFIIGYQHSWNTSKGKDQFLANRAKIWSNLHHFLHHIPRQIQMVLMDNFNIILMFDPPYINNHDVRASSNIHIDREFLQQLMRTQDLVALSL